MKIHCAQCWKFKPERSFRGKCKPRVVNCAPCRRRMGAMSKRRAVAPIGRDPGLDAPGLRVLWLPEAKDRKLGGIPACYVSGATCPDACALKGAGCYAETAFQKAHWRRASRTGDPWETLLERVRALPPDALWRYAVAGDLPGIGDELDRVRLAELVEANRGRLGFTFTHKPVERIRDMMAVARANANGFTINLSADGLREADRKAGLGIGPVVAVVGSTFKGRATPEGRRVVVCPAELRPGKVTCASCRLCAQADRESIVAFRAHGNHSKRVSLAVAA